MSETLPKMDKKLRQLQKVWQAIIIRGLCCNEFISALAKEFGVSCKTIRRMNEKKSSVDRGCSE